MATKKDAGWIEVTDRLPTDKEAGGFGAVEVIVQCNPASGDGPWQVMKMGICWKLGGDPDRPFWVSSDKPHEPIENAAWWVTHWRPFPKFPEPIDRSSFRGF
jgi:hypothetical protein